MAKFNLKSSLFFSLSFGELAFPSTPSLAHFVDSLGVFTSYT